jgi:ribosomal protein S6
MNDKMLALVTETVEKSPKLTLGKRMLAYPIKKHKEGYYFVDYFKLDSLAVKKLKAQFNINENILRHYLWQKIEEKRNG